MILCFSIVNLPFLIAGLPSYSSLETWSLVVPCALSLVPLPDCSIQELNEWLHSDESIYSSLK
jgi:hypothetical protein